MIEKINKTDSCFYQIVVFVVRKNQGSLKMSNYNSTQQL